MKRRFAFFTLRKLSALTLAILVLSAFLPLDVLAAELNGSEIQIMAPANISAVTGSESITLMWDSADSAVSYKVFYKGAGQTYSDPALTSDTSIVLNGLVNGETYTIQISSVNENNEESELSDSISATPEAPNPPSAPIIDQAVAGDSSIAVTWQLLTDSDVAGYFVNYKERGHQEYTRVDAGIRNSFELRGLTNGIDYEIAISAYDNSVEPQISALSAVKTATPQASLIQALAVVNLTKADPGSQKVKLTWDAYTGATSYQVRVASSNTGIATAAPIDAGVATSYTVTTMGTTGLENGKEYFFAVDASNDVATRSAILSATPKALDVAITTPTSPYTLSDEKLTVTGTTSVPGTVGVHAKNTATDAIIDGSIDSTGTWTIQLDGLVDKASYDVWADMNKLGDADESNHVTVNVDRTAPTLSITSPVLDASGKVYVKETQVTITGSCDVADLKVNSTTPVTVTSGAFTFSPTLALNTENKYDLTATGTNGKTTTKTVIIVQDQNAPAIIDSLSSEVGNGQIKLLWTGYTPGTDVSGYNVYSGTSSTALSKSNSGLITTKSYTVGGLTNGTTYYFAVSVVDKAGNESEKSTVIARVPSSEVAPNAPTSPAVTAYEGKLKVTWTASSGAGGYKVYYGTTSGSYGNPIDAGNVTSYEITGLTNGTKYYIAVSAYDATSSKHEGSKSSEVSGTPSGSSSTMTLTISVDKATAQLGEVLNYTIDYRNSGASGLTGVKVTAFLPSNLSYIANSATGSPTIQDADKTLVWSVGNLSASTSGVVTFKGTINSSTSGTVLTRSEMTSTEISTTKTANVTTSLGLALTTTATDNAQAAQSTDPLTSNDPNSVSTDLPNSLPYTGLELRWFFLMALSLIAIGTTILLSSRRRLALQYVPVGIIKRRYLWTSRR